MKPAYIVYDANQMSYFMVLNILRLFCLIFYMLFLRHEFAYADDTVIINNVSEWHHGVRKVLEKNRVLLSKVELKNNKSYPVFYVAFPYDPQSSETSRYFHKLYLDVLEANGYWDYSFIDAADGLLISIRWNRITKTMKVDYGDLDKPVEKQQKME